MKNLRGVPLVLTIAAALVVAASGWLVPLSRNSQAAPAPSSDAAFKGKVLLVQTDNTISVGFIFEKAHLQKIGDRSFLVGKCAAFDGGDVGQLKGRTVRIQMDHIVSITEFDDLKDTQKAGGALIIGRGFVGQAMAPAVGEPIPPAPPDQPPPPAPPRRR